MLSDQVMSAHCVLTRLIVNADSGPKLTGKEAERQAKRDWRKQMKEWEAREAKRQRKQQKIETELQKLEREKKELAK